ncbi:LppU/SCO3897 family protein [Kitasatospora sp. CB01950]|uniref:LppU/SCO3897 family protein n=1 Tax=Kitasatospora sp. CB01950 TaxID=1703930 RepID=UPI00093DA136|nr:hypothetical protein [Kitasatospora sp. CB01950]
MGAFPGAEGAAGPQGPFAGPFCRFCGSVPAVEATVRGHQGIVVIMRFLKLGGPFCRDCGLATVRRMTARSMWQGWWSYGSMVVNPVTMLYNLVAWSKIRRLSPPLPGAPGTPAAPGRPLWQRAEVLGLLLPVLLVAALVWNVGHQRDDTSIGAPTHVNVGTYPSPTSSAADPANVKVGECLHQLGNSERTFIVVVPCGAANADAEVVGRSTSTGDDACEAYPKTDSRLVRETGAHPVTLCLRKVQHTS